MEGTLLNIDKLRETALDQCGYITTAQANSVGVTKAALSMMLKRGRLWRVAHGVYEVPQMPVTQDEKTIKPS